MSTRNRRRPELVSPEHERLRNELEESPATWLPAVMPATFDTPMSWYHRAFWSHVWECRSSSTPDPVLFALYRDGGKSTSAEAAALTLGLTRRRRYALYVSATQALADDHVGSIEQMWRGNQFARLWYPEADPSLTREGAGGRRATWRRNRLTFGTGFTVDAVGLDTALRGLKLGTDRPDLIILDEFDDLADSKGTTAKKVDTLTRSVLPTEGAGGAFVIVVQNLIFRGSVMDQLMSDDPPALQSGYMIGPIPIVDRPQWGRDADGRRQIIAGEPTWPAKFPIEAIRRKVLAVGEAAFRSEYQHELTAERSGALWRRRDITVAPLGWTLATVVVAVDPAAKGKKGSDETGIIAIGRATDGRLVVLEDESGVYQSASWPEKAVALAIRRGAREIAYEDNGLGDAGTRLLRTAADNAGWSGRIVPRSASKGQPKDVRAEPLAAAYQRDLVVHACSLPLLEDEMCLWVPGESTWSPGRIDALVWGADRLGIDVGRIAGNRRAIRSTGRRR